MAYWERYFLRNPELLPDSWEFGMASPGGMETKCFLNEKEVVGVVAVNHDRYLAIVLNEKGRAVLTADGLFTAEVRLGAFELRRPHHRASSTPESATPPLLQRFEELESERDAIERAHAFTQAECTRLTLRVRELEAMLSNPMEVLDRQLREQHAGKVGSSLFEKLALVLADHERRLSSGEDPFSSGGSTTPTDGL